MITVNPYLNFPGTTEEAFLFYKSVFGGEFTSLQRFKDTPDADKIAAGYHDKIMHIALPVGGNILMATDALEGMGHPLVRGTNFYVSLNVESKEEADRVFAGLSVGAQNIEMPLGDTFWGDYFGMWTDKFGIQWMVSFAQKK